MRDYESWQDYAKQLEAQNFACLSRVAVCVAEIDRLRKALRKISNHVQTVSSPVSVNEMREIAREALRDDKPR